jgi:hypothetical protein
VKKKVLDAAVSSVLMYGSESWFTNSVKCVESAILGCLKALLGVRSQTSSDLVYIETGTTPTSAELKARQYKFICKFKTRPDFNLTLLGKALHIAMEKKNSYGEICKNTAGIRPNTATRIGINYY